MYNPAGFMQRISILYDASQAVLSTFDLDQVLNHILAIARDYFRLRNGGIMLLDPVHQELRTRAAMGDWNRPSEVPLPVGSGLSGSAAQLRRPVYVPDVTRDSRYIENIPGTRSEIAIPLIVRDEVVGVLDLQSDQPDFFDADTIDLLCLFSTQASIAIQNAHLYSGEQRRSEQLEAINEIARQATIMLDLDELLDNLCAVIVNKFHVDHVSVVLSEGDRLVVRRHRGSLTPRFSDGLELPEGVGLCARALFAQEPVIENNVLDVPGYIPGYEEASSEVCLPMISFGEPLGVLVVDSARARAFEPGDVQALRPVADICATAIQNAHHLQRARQLANSDGLTGIFNRRFFEERILEEIERSRRYQGGMAIIMIDIDHFKKLNDEFGHLLGDEVLRQVAGIFTQQVRKLDVVCRFGGEEFCILVPETTGAAAVQVAEKLRRIVESWRFPGLPRPVTISAGVADFPDHGQTRDEVVRAADTALYMAKTAGRNRVVTAVRRGAA